jgi:hypothetical protein
MGSDLLVSLSVDEAETLIKSWVKQAIVETKPEDPASNLSKYRTRKEVCQIFKLSLPTLDKYDEMGFIRSKKLGNRILYSEEDIQAALRDCPTRYSVRK